MDAHKHRLFVLGDMHYRAADHALWKRNVEDINALRPDVVLCVGDLTYGIDSGTPAALEEAVGVLSALEAPWHSVIGNHDLEAKMFTSDAEAVKSFLQGVGRSTPWFRLDCGPFSVIGLSNTCWRSNLPETPHEIVFEDEQLEWCHSELARIEDRPVFILAHVPPLGSGLMTLPEVHPNHAFVNQNHAPGKVLAIVQDHPNVVMWFSGHTHVSQHYKDALTNRMSAFFAHVGVAGRHTRDGFRHSRVIDIAADWFAIRTFDHSLREIDERLDHIEPYSLERLMECRKVRRQRRKFIAPAASTMRVEPGKQIRRLNERRFAFLSGLRMDGKPTACQERILEWAVCEAIFHGVDEWICGGNMTLHAKQEEAEAFLSSIAHASLPGYYLPGENETKEMVFEDKRMQLVSEVKRLAQWPGYAYALAATDACELQESLRELVPMLPDEGRILIFSYLLPSGGGKGVELLQREGFRVDWVCGQNLPNHGFEQGNPRVYSCAGLDPGRSPDRVPEMLIGDWSEQGLQITRIQTPPRILNGQQPLGPACYRKGL